MHPINRYFFRPQEGNQKWTAYALTLLVVLLTIGGFGGMAWQIAFYLKGITLSSDEVISDAALSQYFSLNQILTFSVFPFILSFLALIFATKFIHFRPVLAFITNRSTFGWSRYLSSFFIWFGITLILFYVQYLSAGKGYIKWNYNPVEFIQLVLIALFLIPLQTGCEELFFRGFLMQFLGNRVGKGVVVVLINGVCFSALHGMNPEMQLLGIHAFLFYTISGCFASLMTILDDGIELAWGFHTANNIFGVVILTNDWQVFQTDALFIDTSQPEIGPGIWLFLLVLYPALLVLFNKVFKWKDWKRRLFDSKTE